MTASLCATAWDSKISIFQGSCTTPTCVGGIDDNGPACAGTAASYTWTSTPGVTYFILVHGFNSTSLFSLNLSCTPPPPPGPCLNPTAWAIENLPTPATGSVTSSCAAGYGQYTDEYSQWNGGISGETYTVWSTAGDWITVTEGSPTGPVVSYGSMPLDFTAPTNNTYYVHINANGYCLDDANCRDVMITTNTALPIELLTFTGSMFNDKVLLEWSTATEYNNDYFFIERSTDGYVWTKITEVDAAGNSTITLNYLTFDEDPRVGINYYRLTQVDYDGQYETFTPIAVNMISSQANCDYVFLDMNGKEVNLMTSPAGVYIKRCGTTLTKFFKN